MTIFAPPHTNRIIVGNAVYTRAEIIEEHKAKIEQLINATKHFRDLCNENSPEWFCLDAEIDRLRYLKDTIHLPDYQPEE